MDEKKLIEEQCGILYDVIFINGSTALYVPKYVIEGSLGYNKADEKYYFIDKYGNEFFQSDDGDVFIEKSSECVGFIISKAELANTYKEVSFEEGVAQYFAEICHKTYLGFYIMDVADNTSVQQLGLDLEELATVAGGSLENENDLSAIHSTLSNNTVPSITVPESNLQQEVVVMFTQKDIENLVNASSIEEVRAQLKDAVDLFSQKEEEKFVDANKFVEEYCNELKSANGLEEVRAVLGRINVVLVKFALRIDQMKEKVENYGFEFKAENVLSRIIDVCIHLRELEDISHMKEEMFNTLHKESADLAKLFAEYDDAKKLEESILEEESHDILDEKLNVREMKQFLDASVIGQDEAKKMLISSILKNSLLDDYQNKSIGLLVGPTGSGKTLLLKTIKKYLGKPMVIIDSTQLTMQGYVGYGVEDFLGKLLEQTKGDVKAAEEGIVVFDEVDKKGSDRNQDVSGKGVLNMLLSFMEGTNYSVKYRGAMVSFNTEKLKVYATGSFAEVVRELNGGGDYKNSSIGFGTSQSVLEEDIVYPVLTLEDLEEYGKMPPEFLGRISMIVQLQGHTFESLRTILTSSKVSPLLSEVAFFEKLGMSLACTEDFLDKVALKALELKTGARSLKKIIEDTVVEARLEAVQGVFDGKEYAAVMLTENTLNDPRDCMFIDVYANQMNLKDILEKEKSLVKTI